MFEKFTDRARKSMALAQQECQSFHHEHVNPEHVLLGLIKEGSGVASAVLKNIGCNISHIRLKIEELVKPGPEVVTIGKIPNSPRGLNFQMEWCKYACLAC